MINAIIVDDEPLAQEVLESHLNHIPEVTLIKKCMNAKEAEAALRLYDIDLMYLDIQMPEISGVDFVKSLAHPPAIIFTTAYDQYAVEGFELNAVDYLLKPIPLERFLTATRKAIVQAEHNLRMQSAIIESAQDDFIFVKADKKLVKINFADIVYIEGLKDYVIIQLADRRVVTLQTMKTLDEKLPTTIFMRIHRSYILNFNKIEALTGNMVEVIVKGQSKKLPVGKSYRDELLDLIEDKKL